jgi:hypothetical protein
MTDKSTLYEATCMILKELYIYVPVNVVVWDISCEVNSSQLIRYSRACGSYHDFPDRGLPAYKEATEPRVPIG